MTEFTIETVALRNALATALVFTATDLPPINTVHVTPVEAGVEFAATDRYILSVEQVNVDGEPFEFGIPKDVAKQLLVLLPKSRRGALLESMTTIWQHGEKVTVRIPGDVETAVTFTDPGASEKNVKFIKYQELMDKAQENKSAPADTMAFDEKILTRVFKTLAARNYDYPVRMHFGGEVKPVFVQQGTLTVLVMPCRINEPASVAKAAA